MRNISNKVIAVFIAILTIFSSTIPALAADINQIYGIDTDSAQTNVLLDVEDSEILVSVPKSVIVSGTRDSQDNMYKGYYGVQVQGDWAGLNVVNVVPDATVDLTQKGKSAVTANITQDKTSWLVSETDTVANGVVSTDKLSAGSWNGTFNFNISYENNVGIPEGYSVLYKYDISASENDDVAAYYCVPNANTTPVEVSKESNQIVSTLSNLFGPMTAYAADTQVIEMNGVRYQLSDEDTLVISGQGKMKRNVYADLVDFTTIKKMVAEQFPNMAEVYINGIGNHWEDLCSFKKNNVDESKYEYVYVWDYTNSLYPRAISKAVVYDTKNGKNRYVCDADYIDKDMYKQVCDYIDSIKDEYIVSMPKSVIINEGVTNISNYAFYNCQTLTEITIPNTVTSIDFDALAKTNIKELVIPESVTTIADCAFWGNTSLTSAKMSNNVESIGVNAFQQCTALTEITIPDGIEKIGQWCFLGCSSLAVAHIPKSVTLIETWAFLDCTKLKTIYYGGTEEDFNNITIERQVLTSGSTNPEACLRTATKLYEDTKYGDYSYYAVQGEPYGICVYDYSGKNRTVTIPLTMNGKTVTCLSNTFAHNDRITSVTIPNSVVAIDGAFMDCSNLTNVNLPTSLDRLGTNVFNSTNLMSFEIPKSVTSIGENCFYGSNLTSITIPSTVTSIDKKAFALCKNLKSVYIADSVTEIGDYAFQGCTSLESVRLPKSITEVPKYCFSGCSSLKNLCLNDSITSIGSYAYQNCTGLTEIVIPEHITSVGSFAFKDCTNVRKLVLNKNLDWTTSSFANLNGAEIYIPDMDEDYEPAKFGTTARNGIIKNCTIYLQSDKHLDIVSDQVAVTDSTYSNRVIVDASKFN